MHHWRLGHQPVFKISRQRVSWRDGNYNALFGGDRRRGSVFRSHAELAGTSVRFVPGPNFVSALPPTHRAHQLRGVCLLSRFSLFRLASPFGGAGDLRCQHRYLLTGRMAWLLFNRTNRYPRFFSIRQMVPASFFAVEKSVKGKRKRGQASFYALEATGET